MELCPAPPPTRHRRVRRIAVGILAVLVLWLLSLTALPAALGMQSAVVRSDDAATGVGAGSLVIGRTVASTDVAAGDLLLTGSADHPLQRVLDAPPGWFVTSDASTATADQPNADRVVLTVPYVAWPAARLDTTLRWVLLTTLVLLLAATLRLELAARRALRADVLARRGTSLA